MKRAGLLLSILLMLFVSSGASRANPLHRSYGYDLKGQPITSLTMPGTQAVVLFFAATDCPICNRYIPELQSLESKYAAQHVVVWYVYPNPGETVAGVRQHEAAYGAEAHVLMDRSHMLVKFAHVVITPEVAILIPDHSDAIPFRLVYRGRIDNRYIQLGEQRPRPTQFDLERAIDDVLQHRPVQGPDGPPVGCWIIGQ
jgi:thiol-disulfide isomerase/thioredoxin